MTKEYIGTTDHISDIYEALDTVRDDLTELEATYKGLAREAADAGERAILVEMHQTDLMEVYSRRDHVMKTQGGVTLEAGARRAAAEQYVATHEDAEQNEAARRAHYYNVMIDSAIVDRPLGEIYTGELVTVTKDKLGQTVHLHGGRPDAKGRGTWYNPVAPRTVEVEGMPGGYNVLDTYPISAHSYDPETGLNTVFARTASVEKEYTFDDNSEEYRIGGTESEPVLEHVIPYGRMSILEHDAVSQHMLMDARRKHSEAAQIAFEEAGGPQRSIYETFDTTAAFNPVPVSVAKTQ